MADWRLTRRKGQPVLVNGNLQIPVHVPVHTEPGKQLQRISRVDTREAARIYFAAKRLAGQEKCWFRTEDGWLLRTTRGDIQLRYDRAVRDVLVHPADRLDEKHRLAIRLAYLIRARAFFKARESQRHRGRRWRFLGLNGTFRLKRSFRF